jgi:hypothetical protein
VVVAVIPQIITYLAKLVLLPFAVVTGNGVIKPRLDFVFLIAKSVATCVIIVLRARLDDDYSGNLELNLGVSRRHREGGGEGDRGNRDIHDLHGHWLSFVECDRGWQRSPIMDSVGNYLRGYSE